MNGNHPESMRKIKQNIEKCSEKQKEEKEKKFTMIQDHADKNLCKIDENIEKCAKGRKKWKSKENSKSSSRKRNDFFFRILKSLKNQEELEIRGRMEVSSTKACVKSTRIQIFFLKK